MVEPKVALLAVKKDTSKADLLDASMVAKWVAVKVQRMVER